MKLFFLPIIGIAICCWIMVQVVQWWKENQSQRWTIMYYLAVLLVILVFKFFNIDWLITWPPGGGPT